MLLAMWVVYLANFMNFVGYSSVERVKSLFNINTSLACALKSSTTKIIARQRKTRRVEFNFRLLALCRNLLTKDKHGRPGYGIVIVLKEICQMLFLNHLISFGRPYYQNICFERRQSMDGRLPRPCGGYRLACDHVHSRVASQMQGIPRTAIFSMLMQITTARCL